jgi:cytochrome c-L
MNLFRLLVFASLLPAAPVSADTADTAGGKIQFLHVLDGKPIEFTYRPDQTITPAVEEFHQTARNFYRGDPDAVQAGKKLYSRLCKSCHLEDGTGRIGPNLVDDVWVRPRTDTEKGRFEIIYAGGAGAMQAFGRRIDQDDILKVMAYVDDLRARAK